MQRFTLTLLIAFVLVASVCIGAGCAQQAAPVAEVKAAAAVKAVVFATPDECFVAMQNAGISGSKADQLACMSEALSNYLTGMIALQLQRSKFTDEEFQAESAAVDKVLVKHGYKDKDIMGYLQVVDSPVPGGAVPGFMQIGDVVKDKTTFFTEAEAALKAIEVKSAQQQGKKLVDDPKPDLADQPKLKDVKITGDTAVGSIDDKQGTAEPVHFVKEKGSWKIAAGDKEPDWKKPIQGRFLFQDKK